MCFTVMIGVAFKMYDGAKAAPYTLYISQINGVGRRRLFLYRIVAQNLEGKGDM